MVNKLQNILDEVNFCLFLLLNYLKYLNMIFIKQDYKASHPSKKLSSSNSLKEDDVNSV